MENWTKNNPDAKGKNISFDYAMGAPYAMGATKKLITDYRVLGYMTLGGIEYIRLSNGILYNFAQISDIRLGNEAKKTSGGGKRKSRRNRKSKKTKKTKKSKKSKKTKKSTRRKR